MMVLTDAPQPPKRRVWTLALIASLGGFLFGYDTAVISGTIHFVSVQYALSPATQGWYVSSALWGSIAGVAMAGWLADRYGRKKILVLAALLFTASALGCSLARGFGDLVIYRMCTGVAIGIASMISPLYIAEIAPEKNRGRLVSLYQFAITIGILASYFCNALLLHLSQAPADSAGFWTSTVRTEVWRSMLGASALPALFFLGLLATVPESPRWLVLRGKEKRAASVLASLCSPQQATQQLDQIRKTLGEEAPGFRALMRGGFAKVMLIGMALAFLTQVSGINAIIYYGPGILEKAGLGRSAAFGGQVIIGVVNVLFTLVAIWKIDRLGRKPLLLAGVLGILISLIVIGILFQSKSTPVEWLLIFILLFIACFAFSYGPVIWVLLSEIFPMRIRGQAMSVATFCLWVGTALVGQMTPILLEDWGPAPTFWLFALLTAPALWIGLRWLPETKGRSLEAIEQFWMHSKKSPHE